MGTEQINPALAESILLQADPTGTREEQSQNDQSKHHWVTKFTQVTPAGIDFHQGRHQHRPEEEKRAGPVEKPDDQEQTTCHLGHRGQDPKQQCGNVVGSNIQSDVLDVRPNSMENFFTAHEFVIPGYDQDNANGGTDYQESRIGVLKD
jgi:hypothetical protein